MLRIRCPVLLALLLATLPGCGAGLITGIASSQRKDQPPEANVPELTTNATIPLVPAPDTTWTVVVANAQIPSSARLRVVLAAAGRSVDQRSPSATGQGGLTSVEFVLETRAIVEAVGDPTLADVPGSLTVFVEGVEIAQPFPIELARQPRATVVLETGEERRFLSPLGDSVVLAVEGLRATSVGELQVLVSTRDPSRPAASGGPNQHPRITRVCTGIALSSAGGVTRVTANVPGNAFPERATLFVRDLRAGQSTNVENAFYRPDIALAFPRQGPATGSPATLIGTALVPYDFAAATPSTPPALAFDRVHPLFRKGGRETPLSRETFRTAESGLDRLVFELPPSPDGRPGDVEIVLRVDVDDVTAVVSATDVFLYANPRPFFGPRGAVLDRTPVAVVPIPLDGAPSVDDAPDFAVLEDIGGAAHVTLLLAQENGMFQRFGEARRIANHEVPAERLPRDLCTGDFNRDGVPDLFLANEGAAAAVHHVVLGQARPDAPLASAPFAIGGDPGMRSCRSADFDRDGASDVLLIPGPSAALPQPQLLLARPTPRPQPNVGEFDPAFALPTTLPMRPFVVGAVEIADLDGDGNLDVAALSADTSQLDVAFGRGDGSFADAVFADFTVPGHGRGPGALAIGLHACADRNPQSLAVVLAGMEATGAPGIPVSLVTVLHQRVRVPGDPTLVVTPRRFHDPVEVLALPPPVDLAVSMAADIDSDHGSNELVIAARGAGLTSGLALLRYDGVGYQVVLSGIDNGAEAPRQITALHFARAFPATPLSAERRAVFVVHETEVDGVRERRLSTRLVIARPGSADLALLPPDAGGPLEEPVAGIVGGNFHAVSVAGAGRVRDVAAATTSGIRLVSNDGFGGELAPSTVQPIVGILPSTLTLLPAAGAVESLAFLTTSGRIGVWQHRPPDPEDPNPPPQPDPLFADLRQYVEDPRLLAAAVGAGSHIVAGDVDGDGIRDLVVLLAFDLAARGEGDARLAVLRGLASAVTGEFPFAVPERLTAVHGNATALALGDFSVSGPGLHRLLELAVAVPVGAVVGGIDGDHVRFFRFVGGGGATADRFVASAAANGPQVLLAGSGPARVEAGDFDRDGRDDLLVATAGDGTLRQYRNVSLPTGLGSPLSQGEVDVAAFRESLTSPRPLLPGVPRILRRGDVNGDGSADAVVVTEAVLATSPPQRSSSVAFYLSDAAGGFGEAVQVSPTRLGDRDSDLVLDLGDFNRDGVLDLFCGWNTAGAADRNLRVLLGGSR